MLAVALLFGVAWHRREIKRGAGAVKPDLMTMKPNPTYLIAGTADPDDGRVPARPGYQPLEAENGVYGDFVQNASTRGASGEDYSVTTPDGGRVPARPGYQPLEANTPVANPDSLNAGAPGVTARYHALSPEKHGYENVAPDDTVPVQPRGYVNVDPDSPPSGTAPTTAV